jgi:hypothetical protein
VAVLLHFISCMCAQCNHPNRKRLQIVEAMKTASTVAKAAKLSHIREQAELQEAAHDAAHDAAQMLDSCAAQLDFDAIDSDGNSSASSSRCAWEYA